MNSFNLPDNFNYDTTPFFYLDDAVLGGVIIGIILLLMLAFAVTVITYIFGAIGLYTLAKRRNIANPFFAYIPIANSYLTGVVADDINRTMNKKSKYGKTILFLELASFLLPLISLPITIIGTAIVSIYGLAVVSNVIGCLITALSSVISVCCAVYLYISYYKIFKEYVGNSATAYLVISIIFPVTLPFFIFSIRNKVSGYELWCNEQQARAESATAVTFEEQENEHTVEEVFAEQPEQQPETEQTIIDTEYQDQ